jgi:MFS family permease
VEPNRQSNGPGSAPAVSVSPGQPAAAAARPGAAAPPATRRSLRASLSILADRDYRYLLVGNAMTFAGFQVRQMAIAWLVLEQTDSSLKAGVVNAMPGIAIICLSIYAGAIADRSERRRIIAWSRFVITALLFLSAFLVATDVIQWWHFIPIGLGIGVMFAFHNPASQAYSMDVVGRERILSAAALNTAVSNLANIAGPALGGLLLKLGIEWAFWLLVVLYGSAYLGILPLKTKSTPPAVRRSILTEMRAGLRYVWGDKVLKWLMLMSFGSIFNGIALAMVPVFARSVFDVGETGYGWFLTTQGAGSLLGAVVLTATGEVRRKGLLIFTTAVISAAAILVFAVSPWYWMALAAIFVSGLTQGISFITIPTVVQTHASQEMRGRVIGIFFMIVLVFQLGWIVAGVLESNIGARETAAIAAGGAILLTLLVFGRSRELRRLT